MASTISLGGVDLPDGTDTNNGVGLVHWEDRDAYQSVAMDVAVTLGGRVAYAQRAYSGMRPITLELIDRAWLTEAAKNAIWALSVTPGEYDLVWGSDTYSVLFDSSNGPSCPFRRKSLGVGFSVTYWTGTIYLLTVA
jgi:hypothetical protein